MVANKKKSLGQFFTKNHFWLKKHILEFIKSTNTDIICDPFAGAGDLLNTAKDIGFKKVVGYDIDKTLNWQENDSLISIPKIANSIIITNPPYLTNYSAKRQKIYKNIAKYLDCCAFNDLYQLALAKCLENNDFIVAIVPETFINANFNKSRLNSITIIEDNMFNDTKNPVCVVCFDNKNKLYSDIKMYKNNKYIGNLDYFEKLRKKPSNHIAIKFNTNNGQIALRAIDGIKSGTNIAFMQPNKINYNLSKISHSSRAITLIRLDISDNLIDKIIINSNKVLLEFRKNTCDVILSPFKGNKNNGKRRRRLDYRTARAILEESFINLNITPNLFN